MRTCNYLQAAVVAAALALAGCATAPAAGPEACEPRAIVPWGVGWPPRAGDVCWCAEGTAEPGPDACACVPPPVADRMGRGEPQADPESAP